ncbi:MAG: type II secretion system F family protein [Burkholderiaceae bacterium]
MTADLSWPLLISIFLAASAGFALSVIALRVFLMRYRERFGQQVQSELQAAFLFTNVSHLFILNVTLVIVMAALTYWMTAHWLPSLAVAVLLSVAPRFFLKRIKRRRLQAFRGQLPEVLSLLSVSLRAGAALNSALGELAEQMPPPARQEITMLLREQRMGRSMDDALSSLEARMPLEETMLLVSSLRLGLKAGGSLAETLLALATAMRRRLMLEGKVRALTAQGRMQAWVMGLLPFGVLAALLFMQPELTRLYFATVEGLTILGLVVALQIAGAWVIRRMVAIEV